jgi:uncharacterized protein YlaI
MAKDSLARDVYFDPEFLKAHTVRLMNDPLHAYLCSGEDCRIATNKEVNEEK